jgi:2-succinyl-6-hydroxy-2,4-cyclohexadiene-1-carboxylate synthase
VGEPDHTAVRSDVTPLAAEHLPAPPEGGRGRVVLVHGFTQTRASWMPVAEELHADGHEVIAVDAPGHGESGGLRLDLPNGAEALGATCGVATYIGYSMGGRLALHLAVARPELVERLVLVSSTAGIADDADRAERRAEDEARADRLERDGLEAFLTGWLAQPMFATLPSDRAQLAARLGNTVDGLASSLRVAGTGAQRSLWSQLPGLSMPVLFVTGGLDAKFTGIAAEMASAVPRATMIGIAGAGHTVHLERPAEFLAVLRRWLATTPRGTQR